MKPAAFAYYRPQSVAEALAMLAQHGDDGKVLAGGQSLVAAMNFRLVRPAVLLDINDLQELEQTRSANGVLSIGALTRHATFHKPVVEGPLGILLAEVVKHIAHYPIRQRGTFGGSLAHADPASEWCLIATALDAEMMVRSGQDENAVPASAFFRGTFTTALKPHQLLTEIRVPLLGSEWRTGFFEFSRRAGDFALAMAVAALKIVDGRIAEARLAVGGVADRAIRLTVLERQLTGEPPTAKLFAGIADAARDAIDPTEDIHASKQYRRDLVGVVVKRALQRAVT